MADFLLKNLRMAISAATESPFNITATGNFHRFTTTSRAFYVPTTEKFDDRGQVGIGQEFPNVRYTGYLNAVTMEISSNLDHFIHPILMRRGCGTTATSVAGSGATAGTNTHTFKVAATITQLPSSTLIWGLGGADYAWNGATVDSWRVEQTRADIPTFTASIVGTGKRSSPSGLTLNSYVVPEIMRGAETVVSYTVDRGGGATEEFLADRDTNVQRLTGWNVGIANNNDTNDRRPGDPRNVSGNPKAGHYVNRMRTGDREVTGEITITLDSTMQEVTDSLLDQILTDFTITTKGGFIGATTVQYSTSFIFPKCYINTEEGVDDNGLAVIRTTITPVYESVADTILKIVVVNDKTTLI